MAPIEEIGQQPAVQPPSLDDLFKALTPTREAGILPPDTASDRLDIDPALIRQWARNHGREVSDRGRLPESVVDAYLRFQRSRSTTAPGATRPTHSPEASVPREITATSAASTPATSSTPPGMPRGRCPIVPGHPLSVYGTRNLVQFVQWIQRDGIVRTEETLVEEVIRELKLPGAASAWALSRIKDVIQEARHQAQRKDAPAAKKPPSRPASEVSEPKQSAKTSPSTPPGILAPSSTPPGIPRGRCPIVPGHPLSVYGTPDLIQFVQWIQRDGIVRTEETLVEEVIRELKLPGPASVWALSRIKDVIQEARHQAQRKDTPAAKKSPSRPSTRPASDGAARSRLSELAFELLNHGIQVRLAESEDVLIVHGPASIASAAGGRIEASISSGYFVWGASLPRSTHPIADHRGAAQAILATGASSTQEKTKAAAATATPVRTRPTCPVPRGRSIFAYTDYELIAFVKWMKDDGIQRSKDQLIRDVIDELSSSTQTVGALQRVRQALRDVDDHEVLVPKAAIGAVGGREGPTGSRSPGASKPSGNHRSVASRSRSGPPITAYKQEELVAMIRTLADNGHANTYDDLIDNMISELKLPARTPLRVQIIEEAAAAAGWISRSDDETGAFGEASFTDVIAWARAKRYELETDKEIPEHVVFQYNHTHPGRPYAPRNRRP